ncbi:PRC-barrel domain-containing protein [Kaistia dalseonensis]|uniref:Sporulation protein YlmC with PRC-barrel domain n=1 Tax=Kaistia dalseonensis TaxID=410840 RepID=A0ABU0HB43_9HYPH|nr:PRC-barrel domain-containing protein [Kaistia dalseonensis]MCX5496471.1 PRC-barrel domain-containing protein [Kaistia dalseonensis]MDQ0439093.1 sporulation protein YlmC with PRC-barrel domain [Kaistia dalseonensis]
MKHYIIATTAALFLIAGTPAFGQDAATPAPQETVGVAKIDPSTVATGWRASKIIGTTVVNENNETIGAVDDLILTADEKVPFAILSVGGFLGIGTKLVAVPYSSLDTTQKGKTILPGATKDSLSAEPAFKYAES